MSLRAKFEDSSPVGRTRINYLKNYFYLIRILVVIRRVKSYIEEYPREEVPNASFPFRMNECVMVTIKNHRSETITIRMGNNFVLFEIRYATMSLKC